jgi:pantoate--beta-alanine ligase
MQSNQENFPDMNIVTNINDWQQIRKHLAGKSIGFVPTMGNLHAGHLSLCERSHRENDITVVSIFVNPTQFNQTNDFNLYPRTLDQDKKLLEGKVDYLFFPDANTMYADNYQVQVMEIDIANLLEGEYRPGHFTGMLTVVLKLLNLIQANKAYFGEKDFQQLLLIKKMVSALFLPVEIISCETVRAEDGLALSSRNSRLNAEQRKKARYFPELLQSYLDTDQITKQLQELGFKVDYIKDQWQRRLGAVWIDDVRLIDNIKR